MRQLEASEADRQTTVYVWERQAATEAPVLEDPRANRQKATPKSVAVTPRRSRELQKEVGDSDGSIQQQSGRQRARRQRQDITDRPETARGSGRSDGQRARRYGLQVVRDRESCNILERTLLECQFFSYPLGLHCPLVCVGPPCLHVCATPGPSLTFRQLISVFRRFLNNIQLQLSN